MTERERLIELMKKITNECYAKECKDCSGYGFGADCGAYARSDYLLANGVLCPPCKVGDTVYYLTTVDTEKELNVNEIFYGTVQGVSFDGKNIWISARYANGLFYCHKSNEFGKTVFLSRELAEEALEAKQNDKE